MRRKKSGLQYVIKILHNKRKYIMSIFADKNGSEKPSEAHSTLGSTPFWGESFLFPLTLKWSILNSIYCHNWPSLLKFKMLAGLVQSLEKEDKGLCNSSLKLLEQMLQRWRIQTFPWAVVWEDDSRHQENHLHAEDSVALVHVTQRDEKTTSLSGFQELVQQSLNLHVIIHMILNTKPRCPKHKGLPIILIYYSILKTGNCWLTNFKQYWKLSISYSDRGGVIAFNPGTQQIFWF